MAPRDEESLIDEMRATIRADRERAAARHPKAADPPPRADPAPAPPPPPGLLRRLLGR